jgi:hypothetical protein
MLKLGLAGAASLPFLKYATRPATAAATSAPQRLILFPSMNGADRPYFWPNPGNLAAMSTITAPLAAYQSQMTFVDGLDIEGSYNHFAVRSMFTGFPINDYLSPDPTVKSVDQVVADHFAATAPTARRSLHLGAIPADSIDFYMLYGRSTFFFAPSPVNYEANPVTAFDQVFGGLGGGGTPPPAAGPDYQKEVLAIADAELGELTQRAQSSARERSKLVAHREAVGTLAAPDLPPATNSCDASPLASVEALRAELEGNAAGAYQSRLYDGIMDAQIDTLARAVTCGITRVATLQAGSADGNVIVPVGGGLPHHNTSHGAQDVFAQVQNWYAQKFARLVKALDVPDPLDPAGNTVLHNSCVVWLSECLPQSHGSDSVPCFFVGGAGGALKTGGYVDVHGATNRALLKTLCKVMGVPDADSAHFGSTVLSEIVA